LIIKDASDTIGSIDFGMMLIVTQFIGYEKVNQDGRGNGEGESCNIDRSSHFIPSN
jgi:hypothetical protein